MASRCCVLCSGLSVSPPRQAAEEQKKAEEEEQRKAAEEAAAKQKAEAEAAAAETQRKAVEEAAAKKKAEEVSLGRRGRGLVDGGLVHLVESRHGTRRAEVEELFFCAEVH